MLTILTGPLAALVLTSSQMDVDTDYEQWQTYFQIALSGTSAREGATAAATDAERIADDAVAIIRRRLPVWRRER